MAKADDERIPGGEVLRGFRLKAGLTQEDVAGRVRRSVSAVSQWENGTTSPRRVVAMELDRLLGAGGEILTALGYVAPDPDEVMNRRLAELEAQMAELRGLVDELLQATIGSGADRPGSDPSPD